MLRPSKKRPLFLKYGLTIGLGFGSATALAAVTPAQAPKPISDEEWKAIAGGKLSESYEIVKGDTLSGISHRLFGDAKYWPKIWALNNATILNPHLIYPGNRITFVPGTGSSLPGVQVGGAPPPTQLADASQSSPEIANDADTSNLIPHTPGRSQEWRKLPTQRWESVRLRLPPSVDKDGFDRGARVRFGKPKGLELQYVAASERMNLLGQIVGSRIAGNYPSLGDVVYIRPDAELQVGDEYSITQEPALLKARRSDRLGYSYPVLGTVRIIGVKDGLFIGTIQRQNGLIFRGASLMPRPPRVPAGLAPILGPRPIEAVLMVDRTSSTSATAQFKQGAFVDRGSDEGVKPGMIFRAYQYYDPSNEKKITDADIIIEADLMVLQTSPSFSAVAMISSKTTLSENATVVLLTDVSQLQQRGRGRETIIDTSGRRRSDDIDQLDQLDVSGSGLGKEEERELRQLERWGEDSAPIQDPNAADPNAADPNAVPLPENALPADFDSMPPPPPDEAPPTIDAPLPEENEPVETGRSGEALPPIPPPEEE